MGLDIHAHGQLGDRITFDKFMYCAKCDWGMPLGTEGTCSQCGTELVVRHADDEWAEHDIADIHWETRPHVHLYPAPGCPDVYDGIEEGHYAYGGEEAHARIGYGSYSRFRSLLAAAFVTTNREKLKAAENRYDSSIATESRAIWNDPDKYAGKPFVELINYSDCEGFFGPKMSAKLAKDFDDHTPPPSWKDEWWAEFYQSLGDCFRCAAGEGVVVFQ